MAACGRADHDDSVAGSDDVVAARAGWSVFPDDRRDLRVLGALAVAERDADDVRRGAFLGVELDDLDLAVGENVGLARGGNADDPADRVGRLELRRDDEVDVELAGAPELDVLDVRRSDDGRRPLRLAAREHARRRG